MLLNIWVSYLPKFQGLFSPVWSWEVIPAFRYVVLQRIYKVCTAFTSAFPCFPDADNYPDENKNSCYKKDGIPY